jgi:hypothetical protein
MALKDGTMRWSRGGRSLPELWHGKRLTVFQKERLKEAVPVAVTYLKTGATVFALSGALKVTHQRVAQVVKLGVEVLLETGRIRPV